MSTRRVSSHVNPQLALLLVILLVASFFLIRGARLVLSQELSGQESPSGSQVKKLVNLVPRHLPLKVKVKNFHNEKWVRDLEVEVTNTSDKPIYFLEFFVVMPDVKSIIGSPVGFPLRYGRMALIDYTQPLQPDDVGIQPGETYTFKISERHLKGWEINKGNRPEPQRVDLIFVQLNFGDGTGFNRTDGTPVPRRMSQSSVPER